MVFDLTIAALVALACSWVACRALINTPIVDLPDAPRKSHRMPTPTSGGIGMALGFAFGLIALSVLSLVWRHELTPRGGWLASIASAFAYGFLLLGFLDDAFPLGPRLKFIVFGALSVGASVAIGVVTALPFGMIEFELGFWFGLGGTSLWVFTLVNCTNFMDGANGLAMGSLAIGLGALALIAVLLDGPSSAAIAACGMGAILGFLFWNFPNGRLFAGDSGALFAGSLAALVSLVMIQRLNISPFVPPLIFLPLLADALLTLAWRASRGRSLLDGHSEHLYQIAQRAGWGGRRIAVAYWMAMALCAAFGVAGALSRDALLAPIALGVLSLTAMVIAALVRRAAMKVGIAEI